MLKRFLLVCGLFTLLCLTILPAAAQEGQIEYGQSVAEELTSSNLQRRYTFSGQAGDLIVATLSSDDFDSYLTLEFDGVEIMWNDDGAGNLNSRIGPTSLSETGEYTLIASSLGGSATGSFELSLESAAVTSLSFGKAESVSLTESEQVAYFTFEGEAGTVIGITIDGDVDTRLSLMDPSGYEVTTSDYGNIDNDHEVVDLVLSSSGVYTLIVQADEDETGDLTLTVSTTEVALLNEGAQNVTFSDTVFTRVLQFEATNGQVYRLTLEVTDGDTASPTVEIVQGGSQTTYTSASNVFRMSFDIEATDTGTATVSISNYEYRDVSIDVTLEEVGS